MKFASAQLVRPWLGTLPLLLWSCYQPRTAPIDAALANRDSLKILPGVSQYFRACNVQGSIAIYDYNKMLWILSDTTETRVGSLPASTFKIPNFLIALEAGIIRDENELIKWTGHPDTAKYGYRPEIYHDMTIAAAFKRSAGWVFVELAKKIGDEKYLRYLQKCAYGNSNLSEDGADFWNFGGFAVSPINQVTFLRALYDETLPFTKRNMEIVKRVMLSEQTADYALHAKTGWTREGKLNTGWWVGYIVTKSNVYFFATRILQTHAKNRTDFAACRKEITMKIFKDLDIVD